MRPQLQQQYEKQMADLAASHKAEIEKIKAAHAQAAEQAAAAAAAAAKSAAEAQQQQQDAASAEQSRWVATASVVLTCCALLCACHPYGLSTTMLPQQQDAGSTDYSRGL